MPITTCVFDAYGTLFDVSAAARAAARDPTFPELSDIWPRLASDWRLKQLHYTWLRAVTGDHRDFWQITQDSLDWSLEAAKLDDPALRRRLLDLYRELEAYPEVGDVLRRIGAEGRTAAILSNGSPAMLADAIASAGLDDLLGGGAISVEEAGVYKPDRRVYDLVGARLGVAPAEVLFVSANGWDAAAAAAYGFRTAWINRTDEPVDRLQARPDHVLPDLGGVPDLARGL